MFCSAPNDSWLKRAGPRLQVAFARDLVTVKVVKVRMMLKDTYVDERLHRGSFASQACCGSSFSSDNIAVALVQATQKPQQLPQAAERPLLSSTAAPCH